MAGSASISISGRPAYTYAATANPKDTVTVIASRALPKGDAKLRLEVTSLGFGKGISFAIHSGADKLAEGKAEKIHFTPAGIGEAADTGQDTGAPVTAYRTPLGRLEGDVRHINITFK